MFCDAHCDTLYEIFTKRKKLEQNDLHIDLRRLKDIGATAQIFAVWTNPAYEPKNAFDMAVDIIDNFYQELEQNPGLHLVTCAEDLKKEGFGAILSIEGGGAIEGKLSNLRTLYRLGVRCMTLTWNGRNAIADGVFEQFPGGYQNYRPDAIPNEYSVGGISSFGREVVEEMNRLGMMIDVSHIAPKGFWDLCEITEKPFIASHSNAKAVMDFPRNLDDAQIKEIVKRKGFIGINLCADFIAENAEISDIIRHIEHILLLGGEDVLGFGADFDGVEHLPYGIGGVEDMPKIFEAMEAHFGAEITNKIKYRNFHRIVGEIIGGGCPGNC